MILKNAILKIQGNEHEKTGLYFRGRIEYKKIENMRWIP